MKVTFLSIAQREYADTVNYYNQENPGLGYEFAAAVDEAIQLITEYPEAWALISDRVRRCRVLRFPYGILYQITTDEIIIVGILHLHRNPESWKNRI